MHHIPKPHDQARILETALKAMEIRLPHQAALQVIAKVMGYKDWKTMSAVSKEALVVVPAPPVVERAPDREPELKGPEDGDLYEALMTVDMTLSGRVRVRAHSDAEARELLREAAAEQYPTGFEVDENYRGSGDFYMGGDDGLVNLTQPEIEAEGDHYGCGEWQDERFTFKIIMSRPNSDSSNQEDWAEVEVSLYVSDKNGVGVSQLIKDYEVHSDNLGDWIEECIENGDFDEQFDALVEQLEQKLNVK
jgi:hypothetical protein